MATASATTFIAVPHPVGRRQVFHKTILGKRGRSTVRSFAHIHRQPDTPEFRYVDRARAETAIDLGFDHILAGLHVHHEPVTAAAQAHLPPALASSDRDRAVRPEVPVTVDERDVKRGSR